MRALALLGLLCLLCLVPQCSSVRPGLAGPALTAAGTGGGAGGGAEARPPLLRKRGVGWGLNASEIHTLAGISWTYNWGTHIGSPEAAAAAAKEGMAFVPMQWGRWGVADLPSHIQNGSRALLGFNEPNHKLQAALTPREAAELWPQVQAAADRLGLRVGSPAAAPCGADCVEPNPFVWWDEFFHWCRGCRVDFLATHLYSCSINRLRSYLRQASKYQRPIWLTEFACPNPGGADVVSWSYMARALEVLDSEPWVERYAWFAPVTSGWLGTSNSLLDPSTGQLTVLGEIYLGYNPAAALEAAATGTSRRDVASSGTSVGCGRGGEERHHEEAEGDASWSQLCSPCISQLKQGARLAALPEAQQERCAACGFWDAATAAPAS